MGRRPKATSLVTSVRSSCQTVAAALVSFTCYWVLRRRTVSSMSCLFLVLRRLSHPFAYCTERHKTKESTSTGEEPKVLLFGRNAWHMILGPRPLLRHAGHLTHAWFVQVGLFYRKKKKVSDDIRFCAIAEMTTVANIKEGLIILTSFWFYFKEQHPATFVILASA